MYEQLFCVFLAALVMTKAEWDIRQRPSPALDAVFLECVRQNKKFAWNIKSNGANISQDVRNTALAEMIENGCKDAALLQKLAHMAELDKPVTLDNDKKIQHYRKWWWLTKEEVVVVTPKTPLMRAHDKNDPAIVKIFQKLSDEQQQQKNKV